MNNLALPTPPLNDPASAAAVTGIRVWTREMALGRDRRFLLAITDRIAAGEDLQPLLCDPKIPPTLQAIVRAGMRTGRLLPLIEGYLTISNQRQQLARFANLRLIYPVGLFLVGTVIMAMLTATVALPFKTIFVGFGVELPALTIFAFLVADFMWVAFPFLVGSVVVILLALTFLSDYLWWIPALGDAYRWRALSEACFHLAPLVECELPFPEALGLAAQTCHSRRIGRALVNVANRINDGSDITSVVNTVAPELREIRPVFQLHSSPQGFPDALRAYSQSFATASDRYGEIAITLLEPIFVVSTLVGYAFTVIALFLPLVKLLNELS